MGMEGHQGPTPTGPQKLPTNQQHIPPQQPNTTGILIYWRYALTIQEILTQATPTAVRSTQGSTQEIKTDKVRT